MHQVYIFTVNSAPRVAAVYQKIYDFHHDLTHQLIKYHCNICATVVLQDAESNFYSDPKPFHEVKEKLY